MIQTGTLFSCSVGNNSDWFHIQWESKIRALNTILCENKNYVESTKRPKLAAILNCPDFLMVGTIAVVYFDQQTQIYAHTCKSWISPASDRSYLNILDMMNSPEKGDSSGHMPTWAQLWVAELRRIWKPAKTILDRIFRVHTWFCASLTTCYESCLDLSRLLRESSRPCAKRKQSARHWTLLLIKECLSTVKQVIFQRCYLRE